MSFTPGFRPSRVLALGLALFPLFLAIFMWERIPEWDAAEYFAFADRRELLGIPNIGDVLSNLPFVVVGWAAIAWAKNAGELRRLLITLAVTCILTGFGSSYFHWDPNVETLFWDRLPMVLLFSSLIGLLVADRVDVRAGEFTALVIAVFSTIHLVLWKFEVMNLRPYLVFQFGAFLWLVLFNLFFRKGRISPGRVWSLLGLYALAKVLEMRDDSTFHALEAVSGHTLKHILAAAAILCIFLAFRPARDHFSSV